jgi:hypothetical protein
VTSTKNPSYSGSRDEEKLNLRPAQAKKLVKPYLKNKTKTLMWYYTTVLPAKRQTYTVELKIETGLVKTQDHI